MQIQTNAGEDIVNYKRWWMDPYIYFIKRNNINKHNKWQHWDIWEKSKQNK